GGLSTLSLHAALPILWARFNTAYSQRFGQSLTRDREPQALDPKAFDGRPADRVADEPARLIDSDFREDRLSRLVRKAVDSQQIRSEEHTSELQSRENL